MSVHHDDAGNRALRVFLQGLALDVLLAVSLLIYEVTQQDTIDWRWLGAAMLRTVAQSAAAFVMRRFLDPSGVPTPLPPANPGPPADPVV